MGLRHTFNFTGMRVSTAANTSLDATELIHEDDVQDVSQIILPSQGLQIVDFCVSTVMTGGKGVAMGLNFEQPGYSCAGHGELFNVRTVLIALRTVKCFG